MGYVVCGEPRSGSTYLTRLLRSTGVLGLPAEFGAPELRETTAPRGPGALPPRLEQTLTPNGVYAFKVFSYQFDLARNVRWAEGLPNLHFVHLERLDLLGQAISLVMARQTSSWMSGRARQRDARYDARVIERTMMQIAHNQARWRVWFARNEIEPLRLLYEEVTEDPQRAAESVALHIGLADRPEIDPGQVSMSMQRDNDSEEWRRRFLAERRRLDRLDDDLWGARGTLRRLYARVRR